jgi:hypothetical protein
MQSWPQLNGYIRVVDLPSWESYGDHVFNIGGTIVILDQDLQNGLKIVRDDAKERAEAVSVDERKGQITYLLLSIRRAFIIHCFDGFYGRLLPTVFRRHTTSSSSALTSLVTCSLHSNALSSSRNPR